MPRRRKKEGRSSCKTRISKNETCFLKSDSRPLRSSKPLAQRIEFASRQGFIADVAAWGQKIERWGYARGALPNDATPELKRCTTRSENRPNDASTEARLRGMASELKQVATDLQDGNVIFTDLRNLVFGVEHGGESTRAVPEIAIP
jgi:hypothetical protein